MKNNPLIVALYLPQFYETEYNNEWWGKGYTEWVACRQATPLFKGHNQPRVPLHNNYYDLSNVEAIRSQMKLAAQYGLDGFAIYQYYSCGKKLLDVPTEIIRDDDTLKFPFFLYWANESWRKSWFGQKNQIVWEQKYGTKEDWRIHFNYCLDYFKKDNYIRIDGKPVYAIYNPWAVPDIDSFIECWNKWAMEENLPGVYFVKTLTRRDDVSKGKFSAVITREPNYTFAHDESLLEKVWRVSRMRIIAYLNKKILIPFNKGIPVLKASYDTIQTKILKRNIGKDTIIGAFCDFDTSPRRGCNGVIMTGANPEKFGQYFRELYKKAQDKQSPMIVINAWNEWAEGAHLEPDEKFGFGYLEKILEVKNQYGTKQ